MIERQSAAKFLKDLFLEKGSTTIPRKGSKVKEYSLEKPDTKLQPLFSSKRVIRDSNNCIYGKRASKSSCKRVKCTYNNIVTFYNSISDFERNNNIPRGSVSSCIRNKRHYKGMLVEYCEDIV